MRFAIPGIVLALALSATAGDAQVARRLQQRQDTAANPGTERRQFLRDSMGGRPTDNLYSQFLFAPEVIMRHQVAIALTDNQRSRITADIGATQMNFIQLQWKLRAEEEKLHQLLNVPNPAEQAVLGQMDAVLAVEQDLKRSQMSLLVRVKNILTPEQQSRLTLLYPGGAGVAPTERARGVISRDTLSRTGVRIPPPRR